MYRAPNDEISHDKNYHHNVVQIEIAFKINQAKQGSARHALQTIFTTREFGLEKKEVDHLRERHRDHRKVDATSANRQRAHDNAHYASNRHTVQNTEFRRKPPGFDGMS